MIGPVFLGTCSNCSMNPQITHYHLLGMAGAIAHFIPASTHLLCIVSVQVRLRTNAGGRALRKSTDLAGGSAICRQLAEPERLVRSRSERHHPVGWIWQRKTRLDATGREAFKQANATDPDRAIRPYCDDDRSLSV